jgi:Rieske Fe-S protein
MRLREYVLVLETVPWVSYQSGCGKRCGTNGPPGTPIAGSEGEIEIPRIVFIKTWEDLLSGHPIWFSGTILQFVLGKGLVYQEV